MFKDIGAVLGIPSIDPSSQYSGIMSFLDTTPLPVDYSTLFSIDKVLFFGEVHSNRSPKDEVAGRMKLLRNAGVTHLAMEMLLERMQPAIDRYYEVGNNKEELLAHFRKKWDCGPGIPEKYLELIDAAKSCGIKIVGLDIDFSENDTRPKTEQIADQNTNWANVIFNTLQENPDTKVLVYCGSGHVGYSQTVSKANLELARKGIISTIIRSIGGSCFVPPLHSCAGFEEYFERAIIDRELGDKEFTIAVKAKLNRSADLYVHLL